jgi:transcriptional regulator with XRE-family HTH domain
MYLQTFVHLFDELFYLCSMKKNKIGLQIKEHRKKLGITQEQLGEKLGMTKQQIANYESGFRIPTIEKTLPIICEALNVDFDIVFTER